MRTPKQTILGHFQDQECFENGPKWPKRGKNRLKITLWAHKLAQWANFGLEGVVCLDILIGVLTLFHTFQPKKGSLGQLMLPKGYL